MPRTIIISGAAKADCLRIRDVLRRQFKQSIIHIGERPDLSTETVIVESTTDGPVLPQSDSAELEKKIRRAEFLLEAARILASRKIDPALWEVTDKSRTILGDTAFVFLMEDNEPKLRCAAGEAERLPLIEKTLVNTKLILKERLQEASKRGDALLINDLAALELPGDLMALVREFQFKSLLSIPIRKDDEVYGFFVTIATAPHRFDDSQLVVAAELAQVMSHSISHERSIAQLERRANTDPLTGLYNTRFFVEVLTREVARAERHETLPLTMLMVDVDDFKQVNDLRGHNTGNEVLRRLAARMIEKVRKEDFVFRYGGDEFAVILPGTDLEGGESVGKHILEGITDPTLLSSSGADTAITVSIGVARYERGEGAETFSKRADEALIEAKNEGKNRVKTYRPAPASDDSADSAAN